MFDSVNEIEAAVRKLPPEGLAQFRAWFARFETEGLKSKRPIRANAKEMMKFRGMIPFKGDPVKIQRQLRDEWPD